MIFRELVLENFGPYAGRQIIDLRPEIDNHHSPIILFGGMNGGGKTTIMDAIRLALYGHRAQCSTRGNLSYGEFLTQSVNNKIEAHESTRIELAFEHIHDDQWLELRIVRSWTRKPKDGKDNLGIISGDWPDKGLVDIWDEYIENLLPIGISNLFLFDGEQVKELAEHDNTPQVVIEAIQSLLGLKLAEKLAIDLDILVNRKKKAIASAAELADIEELEGKINDLSKSLLEAKEKFEYYQAELKKAKNNHDTMLTNFSLEGGKIAAERTKLETIINTIEKNQETECQSLRVLAADILPLTLISPLLEQAAVQIEKEWQSEQNQISLMILSKRNKKLLDFLHDLPLTSQQLEKVKEFIETENKDLNQSGQIEQITYLGATVEQLKQLENILEYQLPLTIENVLDHLNKIRAKTRELEATERQLAIAATDEIYEKLDQALKKAQQEWLDSQKSYMQAKNQCEELDKAIAKAKKDLEKYSEQAFSRQNDQHILKSADKVQKTLQLFRERLTLKKLNKLEVEVTECFRYLLHKSDLVHRVTINTDNFSLSLYDITGKIVSKKRLSAGEKQLLAIAFLWGLARISKRNLPIAIDTPLGRLDSSHRYNLVERYFKSASHQVILFSTDTEIGKTEVELLREQSSISKEYLLQYDSDLQRTTIRPGYFY